MDNQVTLTSQDGIPFKIDVNAANQSETIKNLIEDAGIDNPIPIPNIQGKILAIIVDIMNILVTNKSEKEKEDDIYKILNWQNDADLTLLLLAANYLDIKELLNKTVRIIADKLRKTGDYNRKSLKEFRETEKLGDISDENVFCKKLNTKHQVPLDICKLIKQSFPKMQVICGSFHSMVITENGMLYGAGNNNIGQLGNDSGKDEPKFVHINVDNKKIIRAAGDYMHSLVITEDGMLYGAGGNNDDQLGTGSDKNEPKFVQINVDGKKIVKVACGMSHSMVITEDGMLYGAGSNYEGQLGNGSGKNEPKFVQINIDNKKIVQAACGMSYSMVITEDGILYGAGGNEQGQLGNNSGKDEPKFVQINVDGKKIVQVACGFDYSLAITEDGMLYGAGSNKDEGQLGNGSGKNEHKFVQINVDGKKILRAACGNGHSMVITEDGMLYGAGENRYYELGNGSSRNEPKFVPINVDGKKIVQVACGYKYTMVITEDIMLYEAGQNDYGQLGNESGFDEKKFVRILTIPDQTGGNKNNMQSIYYKKYMKYKSKYLQLHNL